MATSTVLISMGAGDETASCRGFATAKGCPTVVRLNNGGDGRGLRAVGTGGGLCARERRSCGLMGLKTW
ncbi:pyruvate carboxylase subunit A [Sesbania bispinosa]|nr:pyruvate carboxylase subunit A [Sesbania bispinosa]